MAMSKIFGRVFTVFLIFLAGGLTAALAIYYVGGKFESPSTKTSVELLTDESLKNTVVKNILFTLEGEVRDVTGNGLTVASNGSKLAVSVDSSTAIARYSKEVGEATASAGELVRKVIGIENIKVGDRVSLNVRGLPGANLVASDIAVF